MEYWFYLEPYSFIFSGVQGKIIYNTLNGKIVHVPLEAYSLVEALEKDDSGYSVMITDGQLGDKGVSLFIDEVRNTFSGDVINMSESKPFIPKPVLNLLNDPRKLLLENRSLSRDLLENVHEVDIYLNAQCSHKCKYCSMTFRQFKWCTAEHISDNPLTLSDYEKLLAVLSVIGIRKINLISNGKLETPLLADLLRLLNNLGIKADVYVNYLNWDINVAKAIRTSNCTYNLLARAMEVKLEDIALTEDTGLPICWKIAIESIEDFEYIEKISSESAVEIKLLPFYNGNNFSFFYDNVFVGEDEIATSTVSTREIFINQTLNANFFGKLSVFSNGDVYANVVNTVLGNLKKESLNELVYREFKDGTSWMETRNQGTCAQCMYRYLCPPISNYEKAIGKINLCTIKLEPVS